MWRIRTAQGILARPQSTVQQRCQRSIHTLLGTVPHPRALPLQPAHCRCAAHYSTATFSSFRRFPAASSSILSTATAARCWRTAAASFSSSSSSPPAVLRALEDVILSRPEQLFGHLLDLSRRITKDLIPREVGEEEMKELLVHLWLRYAEPPPASSSSTQQQQPKWEQWWQCINVSHKHLLVEHALLFASLLINQAKIESAQPPRAGGDAANGKQSVAAAKSPTSPSFRIPPPTIRAIVQCAYWLPVPDAPAASSSSSSSSSSTSPPSASWALTLSLLREMKKCPQHFQLDESVFHALFAQQAPEEKALHRRAGMNTMTTTTEEEDPFYRRIPSADPAPSMDSASSSSSSASSSSSSPSSPYVWPDTPHTNSSLDCSAPEELFDELAPSVRMHAQVLLPLLHRARAQWEGAETLLASASSPSVAATAPSSPRSLALVSLKSVRRNVAKYWQHALENQTLSPQVTREFMRMFLIMDPLVATAPPSSSSPASPSKPRASRALSGKLVADRLSAHIDRLAQALRTSKVLHSKEKALFYPTHVVLTPDSMEQMFGAVNEWMDEMMMQRGGKGTAQGQTAELETCFRSLAYLHRQSRSIHSLVSRRLSAGGGSAAGAAAGANAAAAYSSPEQFLQQKRLLDPWLSMGELERLWGQIEDKRKRMKFREKSSKKGVVTEEERAKEEEKEAAEDALPMATSMDALPAPPRAAASSPDSLLTPSDESFIHSLSSLAPVASVAEMLQQFEGGLKDLKPPPSLSNRAFQAMFARISNTPEPEAETANPVVAAPSFSELESLFLLSSRYSIPLSLGDFHRWFHLFAPASPEEGIAIVRMMESAGLDPDRVVFRNLAVLFAKHSHAPPAGPSADSSHAGSGGGSVAIHAKIEALLSHMRLVHEAFDHADFNFILRQLMQQRIEIREEEETGSEEEDEATEQGVGEGALAAPTPRHSPSFLYSHEQSLVEWAERAHLDGMWDLIEPDIQAVIIEVLERDKRHWEQEAPVASHYQQQQHAASASSSSPLSAPGFVCCMRLDSSPSAPASADSSSNFAFPLSLDFASMRQWILGKRCENFVQCQTAAAAKAAAHSAAARAAAENGRASNSPSSSSSSTHEQH